MPSATWVVGKLPEGAFTGGLTPGWDTQAKTGPFAQMEAPEVKGHGQSADG